MATKIKRSHKAIFLFLVLHITYTPKATRLLFFCGKMQTVVHLNSQILDGENTECPLCKHCGCMPNNDQMNSEN